MVRFRTNDFKNARLRVLGKQPFLWPFLAQSLAPSTLGAAVLGKFRGFIKCLFDCVSGEGVLAVECTVVFGYVPLVPEE